VATATASPALTRTYTATSGPTSTPVATATASPAPTKTYTATSAPTNTQGPTSTPSWTVSPMATPTATFTASATGAITATVSATAPASATATRTPVFSPSPTPQATWNSTLNAQVLDGEPVPNPQPGPVLGFDVKLSTDCGSVTGAIYTPAMVLVARQAFSGQFRAGWNALSWPLPTLPNGLYYVAFNTAFGQRARVTRLFILH
jgi:hypothetical protein